MAKTPSIEDCFTEIETVIAALEGGELGLEESLKRYEAALGRVRQARAHLDSFQARLEELHGDDLLREEGGEGYRA